MAALDAARDYGPFRAVSDNVRVSVPTLTVAWTFRTELA
jgi:hypothetical protein